MEYTKIKLLLFLITYYSFKTKHDIPNTAIHCKLSISQNGSQYICGKRDLLALVIAFGYLLPNEDFKGSLSHILKHYLESSGAMSENDLYQFMGFPSKWKKISSYRK